MKRSRSVLEQLRPPGGWYQPTPRATEPEQPGATNRPARSAPTPDPGPPAQATTTPAPPAPASPAPATSGVAGGWVAHAACRGTDTELFYPTRGEATEPAKKVCAGCPARVDCLEYALAATEKFGIWGGLSERERRQVRRARRVAVRAGGEAAA
ncbi:MAG: WhiB family transcriptional regulator [Acidimicrobiales bacterium]